MFNSWQRLVWEANWFGQPESLDEEGSCGNSWMVVGKGKRKRMVYGLYSLFHMVVKGNCGFGERNYKGINGAIQTILVF